MDKEYENILVHGAQKMGIKLNTEQIRKFSLYLKLLSQWNKKINLTSLKTPQEIIVKHFLDSLSCIKALNNYTNLENASIIDVGTGAGFPGLPVKIVSPSISLSLLEAKKKKIIFLNEIKQEINFQKVEVLTGRAETFGKHPDYRQKFDIVLSRALASLSTLSEYCLPLARVGGLFVAQKGRAYQEETNKALRAIQLLGGELIGVENLIIPFMDQERYLLIIKKIKDTPLEYPRKEGIPQKRPL